MDRIFNGMSPSIPPKIRHCQVFTALPPCSSAGCLVPIMAQLILVTWTTTLMNLPSHSTDENHDHVLSVWLCRTSKLWGHSFLRHEDILRKHRSSESVRRSSVRFWVFSMRCVIWPMGQPNAILSGVGFPHRRVCQVQVKRPWLYQSRVRAPGPPPAANRSCPNVRG